MLAFGLTCNIDLGTFTAMNLTVVIEFCAVAL